MCEIGDDIKFCTCTTDSYVNLQHYWILHRFNKNKHEIIIGLPILPTQLDLFIRENLQNQLFDKLNGNNAFDFPIEFKYRDQLEIVLNNNPDSPEYVIVFCFKFKNNQWQFAEFDTFDLMSRYDELKFGEIKGSKIKQYFL